MEILDRNYSKSKHASNSTHEKFKNGTQKFPFNGTAQSISETRRLGAATPTRVKSLKILRNQQLPRMS
jgi:hypothetical protein